MVTRSLTNLHLRLCGIFYFVAVIQMFYVTRETTEMFGMNHMIGIQGVYIGYLECTEKEQLFKH